MMQPFPLVFSAATLLIGGEGAEDKRHFANHYITLDMFMDK